jgi:hypothetical protein
VVAQRRRLLERRVVLGLERDDGLASHPLDEPFRQQPFGVTLDQVGVGLDDLELQG